jgi:hypothetical protein
MVMQHTTTSTRNANTWEFRSPLASELEAIFAAIPSKQLLKRFARPTDRRGPKGFPASCLFKIFVASYHCNHESVADTVRQLQNNPTLAIACGLDPYRIPSRPTLSRFFSRLSKLSAELKLLMGQMSDLLRKQLPDFGDHVAVDSSVFPSYSNPRHEPFSDPDASWTKKNDAGSRGGKKWVFGYKSHLNGRCRDGNPNLRVRNHSKKGRLS